MPDKEPCGGNAWCPDVEPVKPTFTGASDAVDLIDESRERKAAAKAMAAIRRPEPDPFIIRRRNFNE